MHFFLDHTTIKKILAQDNLSAFSTIFTEKVFLTPNWSSFFSSLPLDGLLEDFPLLNEEEGLLASIGKHLEKDLREQDLFDLYDLLFVECLTSLKNLKSLDGAFLLKLLEEKKHSSLFPFLWEGYEKKFLETPSQTLHDLILYLAWDRMCVCAAVLFEQTTSDPKKIANLHFFKNCLVESFFHIKKDKKTVPSFFRFVEALYAYDLREEQLDRHTPEAWSILCKGASALKPRHFLSDTAYIDFALQQEKSSESSSSKFVTFSPPENIQASLQLAHFYLQKIRSDARTAFYQFSPLQIVCLQEKESTLFIKKIIEI